MTSRPTRFLCGGLLAACLLPSMLFAQIDDENEPADVPAQVSGAFARKSLDPNTFSRSAAPAPEFEDPAFARYLDLELLAEAWQDLDPALLTDVGLQLAEGERILLRSHKRLTSTQVLKTAAQLAQQNGDSATLDRLARYASDAKNQDLEAVLSAARKTGAASRAADPGLVVSVQDTTPEAYGAYKSILDELNAATVTGDKSRLAELQQSVDQVPALTDAQKRYLAERIDQARDSDPIVDPDFAGAMNKLGGESRRIYFQFQGVNSGFRTEPDNNYSTLSEVDSGPAAPAVQRPAEEMIYYTIHNTSQRTVRFQVFPSGKQYTFNPGQGGKFRSKKVGNTLPSIRIHNTGDQYTLPGGDFKFYESNGRLKWSYR